MNEKFLSELREAVKAFTEADPYFLDLPIINERLKDLEGAIEEKLGPLGGVCIILVTPAVGGVLKNVTGANFTGIRLVARILESVTLNETGKEALDVAIYLAALWSQARPGIPTGGFDRRAAGSVFRAESSADRASHSGFRASAARSVPSGGKAADSPPKAKPFAPPSTSS